MKNIIVRKAEIGDLDSLLDIYNYEVVCGISNLDLHKKDRKEWEVWFYAHNVENHPLYAAVLEGQVVGYASLSPYRDKEAYCSTVELSIYVDVSHRRKGVATALLNVLLEDARRDERTHMVISVITSGNEASQKLHETYGFSYCGTVHEAGFKHGKYRDIDTYELMV